MKPVKVKVIRAVWEEVREPIPPYLTCPLRESRQVFEMFQELRHETREMFIGIHLDTRNRPLCVDVVSVGSLTASLVHPREAFKTVLLSSASAVIWVHNHPSGDCAPSREDAELTRRLWEAGKILGVRVLDHVIIGEHHHYSFADEGEFPPA